jgi:hypothetical protein
MIELIALANQVDFTTPKTQQEWIEHRDRLCEDKSHPDWASRCFFADFEYLRWLMDNDLTAYNREIKERHKKVMEFKRNCCNY